MGAAGDILLILEVKDKICINKNKMLFLLVSASLENARIALANFLIFFPSKFFTEIKIGKVFCEIRHLVKTESAFFQ